MELLRLENVNSFYGRSHILFDVYLEMKAGETATILGRNGSGRTTTLKTIMGLIAPSPGHVFLDGEDISGWMPYRVAKKGVSYVPEERRVFTTLTVRDNLEVAEKVGGKGYWTRERVLDLFEPLKNLLYRKGGHLSGGEQQMVAVARGIIQNPKLLILDEPTEGLAPGDRRRHRRDDPDDQGAGGHGDPAGGAGRAHLPRGGRPGVRPRQREGRLPRHAAGARLPGGHQEAPSGGVSWR